jgi:hypothetical protein
LNSYVARTNKKHLHISKRIMEKCRFRRRIKMRFSHDFAPLRDSRSSGIKAQWVIPLLLHWYVSRNNYNVKRLLVSHGVGSLAGGGQRTTPPTAYSGAPFLTWSARQPVGIIKATRTPRKQIVTPRSAAATRVRPTDEHEWFNDARVDSTRVNRVFWNRKKKTNK